MSGSPKLNPPGYGGEGVAADKKRARPAGEPSRRGKDATRARILDAAKELFGKKGFDATSVKDIARMCGITDAALYYYFRSKREILDDLWRIPQSRRLAVVDPGETMTHEVLDQLIDVMFDGAADQYEILRLTNRQVLEGDRTAQALREQTMANWTQYVYGHFRTSFDEQTSRQLADALTMFVLGVYHNEQIDGGPGVEARFRAPQFREHARAMARLMFPVEQLAGRTGIERPCEP